MPTMRRKRFAPRMQTHRHVQHCTIEFGGLRLRHWRLRGGMAVVEVVEYHWWLWVDSVGVGDGFGGIALALATSGG